MNSNKYTVPKFSKDWKRTLLLGTIDKNGTWSSNCRAHEVPSRFSLLIREGEKGAEIIRDVVCSQMETITRYVTAIGSLLNFKYS